VSDVEAVPPYFAVDMVNVTEIGGDLRVAASVENIGGLNDTQSIRLCREECSNEVIDRMANGSISRTLLFELLKLLLYLGVHFRV